MGWLRSLFKKKERKTDDFQEDLIDAMTGANSPDAYMPDGNRANFEVVSHGDTSHKHEFMKTEWDFERFGSPCIDASPDKMFITYRDLWICECGAEAIESERGLI